MILNKFLLLLLLLARQRVGLISLGIAPRACTILSKLLLLLLTDDFGWSLFFEIDGGLYVENALRNARV